MVQDKRKITRREALGTVSKVAISAIVAGAVAGVGGYLAGSSTNPPPISGTRTVTQTVTRTVTAVAPVTTVMTTPVKLVITQHPVDPNDMYKKITTKYSERVKPGTQIEIVWGPTGGGAVQEYYRIQVEAARNRSPSMDIFNLDVIWGAAFNENDWCIDLSDRFPPSERQKFIPAMIESWTWIDRKTGKERIGAVPWMGDIGGMWYRKDIIEEKEGIRPPTEGWTWEEFFSLCVDLKEKYPDMYMLAIDNAKSEQLICNFQEFLASNGGNWFDEDWNVLIADTPAVEALQAMYDMIYKYEITQPETLTGDLEIARKYFTDGKAIFHRNWSYVWGTSLGSAVEGKVGLTLIPHFQGYESRHTVGGWSWAINPGSRNVEAAWELIQWLTSYDVMKELMLGGSFYHARIDLYKDPDIIKLIPVAPVYYELYSRGTIRPKHPEYTTISDMAQTELHAALSRMKGIEQALNDLATKIADFLGTRVVKR